MHPAPLRRTTCRPGRARRPMQRLGTVPGPGWTAGNPLSATSASSGWPPVQPSTQRHPKGRASAVAAPTSTTGSILLTKRHGRTSSMRIPRRPWAWRNPNGHRRPRPGSPGTAAPRQHGRGRPPRPASISGTIPMPAWTPCRNQCCKAWEPPSASRAAPAIYRLQRLPKAFAKAWQHWTWACSRSMTMCISSTWTATRRCGATSTPATGTGSRISRPRPI